MDQPGKVANPAHGQLNRGNNIPLSAFVPENLVSRDGFGSPVPRQPAHLHTQAESGAYLRDSSRVPRRRSYTCFLFKPPYAIGSVLSLSGHAIAYRWRSLPSVRRHRAREFNYINQINSLLSIHITPSSIKRFALHLFTTKLRRCPIGRRKLHQREGVRRK